MAYNKFITKNGRVLLDLTDATEILPEKLEKGLIAYDRHGHRIVGTGEYLLQEKDIVTPTTEKQTMRASISKVSSIDISGRTNGQEDLYSDNRMWQHGLIDRKGTRRKQLI